MITTHVLDTARGGPAVGVAVTLERRDANAWTTIGRGTTDANGRLTTLTQTGSLVQGAHRLTFATRAYHEQQGVAAPFFDDVTVTFDVPDVSAHYHVPLLLSPFGYCTYRGT